MTLCSAVGSPDSVRRKLEAIADATGADEFILTAQIYDHAARLQSFELAAKLARRPDAAASRVVEDTVRTASSLNWS